MRMMMRRRMYMHGRRRIRARRRGLSGSFSDPKRFHELSFDKEPKMSRNVEGVPRHFYNSRLVSVSDDDGLHRWARTVVSMLMK
jgi:hypothetical protein